MELSPEHEAVRAEARERIMNIMKGLGIQPSTYTPGEPVDDQPEGKN